MAPFTAWLPVGSDRNPDLVLKVVGTGASGLIRATTALERALSEQGLQVMAQTSRLGDGGLSPAVRLRVSREPVTSMGNGCDVVACADRLGPLEGWLGLQAGSVLIHEATEPGVREKAVADGVIAYAVPFADLQRRCGARASGKALIAAGVLTSLLGIPEQAVRAHVHPAHGLHYFDAGVRFAASHLEKRDIYALPSRPATRRQVILDIRQAFLLGLTIGHCGCQSACAPRLECSPTEWLAEHIGAARALVSTLATRDLPATRLYRGPDRRVTAVLGAMDPSAVKGHGTSREPIVVVPSDMLDAVRLVGTARRLSHQGTRPVWIVADDLLARRQQSVPCESLSAVVREIERGTSAAHSAPSPAADLLARSDREGESGADVGFVAWGTAQGVVRETVALCQQFGLRVAALYPKTLWPVPTADLEDFGSTLGSLVVVEPHRTGRYTDLVRTWTSLRCSTVWPEPGRALTPMDIFLREGLGA